MLELDITLGTIPEVYGEVYSGGSEVKVIRRLQVQIPSPGIHCCGFEYIRKHTVYSKLVTLLYLFSVVSY